MKSCNSSRLPWEEAAARSLGTTDLNQYSYLIISGSISELIYSVIVMIGFWFVLLSIAPMDQEFVDF